VNFLHPQLAGLLVGTPVVVDPARHCPGLRGDAPGRALHAGFAAPGRPPWLAQASGAA
jgi:hypothetical protein